MSEYQLMTEDQRDMVKLVKDFLMKEYLPHVSEYEAKGEYPLEFHKKLGELGLFAMDVPEEYGGLGLDAVTTCLIREAIGYVDAGFASSFAASTFGIKPVLLAGTEEQKKAYGARLAEGQISAMCLTEPQSGSDMGNTKCRAVKDGDEYVLNGTKSLSQTVVLLISTQLQHPLHRSLEAQVFPFSLLTAILQVSA